MQQLDHVQRLPVGPLEQQLPLQGGPVQDTFGEDGHAAILSDIAVRN